MVRADLLDAIDEVLRQHRDRSRPFGGVQLLMIGDLQQLAPVVKDEEWKLLKDHYQTPFFFGSQALQKTEYVSVMNSGLGAWSLLIPLRRSRRRFRDLRENSVIFPRCDPSEGAGGVGLPKRIRL